MNDKMNEWHKWWRNYGRNEWSINDEWWNEYLMKEIYMNEQIIENKWTRINEKITDFPEWMN